MTKMQTTQIGNDFYIFICNTVVVVFSVAKMTMTPAQTKRKTCALFVLW